MSSASGLPAATTWRALLANRRYLFFLASLSAGDIGYAVYAVAAPWLAYQVTRNFFDVGAVLAAEFGLYAFSFVAAPFVDRTEDKRSVLLWGYALQAVAAGAIGTLYLTGHLLFPLLLGLVSGISVVWDFTWSANNTIPPLLLSQENLFRAGGLAGLVSGGNQVTGFTVGGALILATGPGGAMLLYAALNAASMVLALRVSTRGSPVATGSVWQAMVEGWKPWSKGSAGGPGGRPLRALSFFVALQGLFAPGAVLLITDIASGGGAASQFTYGVLFTGFVLGGSAIGMLLGHLNPRRSVGRWLVATPAASAVLIFLVPHLLPSLLVGVGIWFAIGVSMLGFEVCYIVYLQASSPPSQVARTTSNVFFFRGTARALGSLALGGLATTLLVPALAEVIGLGLLLTSGVGVMLWASLKEVRF